MGCVNLCVTNFYPKYNEHLHIDTGVFNPNVLYVSVQYSSAVLKKSISSALPARALLFLESCSVYSTIDSGVARNPFVGSS